MINSMSNLKRRGEILSARAQTERNGFILHSNRIGKFVSFTKTEIVKRCIVLHNPALLLGTGLLFVVSRGKMFKWLSYGLEAWRLVGIIKKN